MGALTCTADCRIDSSDCAPAPAVYSELDDRSKWTMFNLADVDAAVRSFIGAVFDGRRYLYLVPYANDAGFHGTVARFDTALSFTTKEGWSMYDIASGVDSRAKGFLGGAFDGHSVYLVPCSGGVVARYDGNDDLTKQWTTIDVSQLDSAATGFMGAAFDGHYLYFSPASGNPPRKVVRYDPSRACQSAGGSPGCELQVHTVPGTGFGGAVFAAPYVYFVPLTSGVARYDTRQAFGLSNAWETFDVSGMVGSNGSTGAVIEGRYLYLVPYTGKQVLRFDTTATTLGDLASWNVFDLASLGPVTDRYAGATSDGRYIYLAPYTFGPEGIVVRFDSMADFTNRLSWRTFDLTRVDPSATGFSGATFDGRYVYLVPNLGTTVASFDAKSPPSLPRQWNASFY